MRNLIFLFIFLTVSLLTLTMFVGVKKTQPKLILSTVHPHFYEKKDISIEKIAITVFYFVPIDATNKKNNDWKEITEAHLKKLSDFHNIQFENTSKIAYNFFPEIIVGERTTKEYENLFEQEDHDALIPIKEELRRRVIEKSGELHSSLKINIDKNTRQVYLVVFEGDGAAGNDDFALISRSYLNDALYKENGSTFLAHEFYHTLGLLDNYKSTAYVFPDGQQVTKSILTSKDIMGQVAIPLSYTYIDNETLKKMGL